jgi:SnoaL-like polyketide cyclase
VAQSKDTAVLFVEAFNAHNESALRTLNAPDISFEAPGGVHLKGREAATDYVMVWLKGLPDAKMIVRQQIISGPWVIQEFTLEGTHTAPLKDPNGTIAPTGKRLVSKGVHIGPLRQRTGGGHKALLRPGRRAQAARPDAGSDSVLFLTSGQCPAPGPGTSVSNEDQMMET